MSRTFVASIAVLLTTVSLSGCLELFSGGDVTSEDLSLARIISLDLGPDTFEDEPDIEELLDTSLAVIALKGSHDVAGLVVRYTDKDGNLQERAVSDLTDQATLAAGDRVEVPDVDLTAPASLVQGETVVVSRGLRDGTFWHVGEVPVGFGMEPGSRIVYDLLSSGTGEFSVAGVTTPKFELTRAHEIVGGTLEGTFSIALGDSAQEGPFGSGLEAPFELDIAGTFPIELSAQGVYNASPFDVGFALEDTSLALHAEGSLWLSDAGDIQGADPGPASVDVDATPILWLQANDPGAMEEPCYGATRADRCDPFEDTEFGLPFHEEVDDEEPVAAEVPEVPDEDQDDLILWKAFLAQGLAVGDAIHVVMHGASGDFGAPTEGDFEVRYDVEVTGLDEARVKAGTFDAYEVITTATISASSEALELDGLVPIGDFEIEETLQRTTLWFDAESLLLLKFEQTFPADVQKVLDTMISAIDLEELAGEEGGEVSGPESVTAVADSSLLFELAELDGSATMSPLFAYGLFQAGPMWAGMALPFMLGGMPFGGFDEIDDEPYPAWEEPGEPYGWNETGHERIPAMYGNVTGEFLWGVAEPSGAVPLTLVSGGPIPAFSVSAWFEGEEQSFGSPVNDLPGASSGEWRDWVQGETRYLQCRALGLYHVTLSSFGSVLDEGDVVCPDVPRPQFAIAAPVGGMIPVTLTANGPATWMDTNVWVSGPEFGDSSLYEDAAGDEGWYGDDWLTGETKYVHCAGSGANDVEVSWAGLTAATATVECP